MNDVNRLADLVQSDGVPIERVAVGSDDDVEVELVVVEVRQVAPKVPRHSGGAQDRPRRAERDRLAGGDHTDALQALAPNGLAGPQEIELVEAVGQGLEHTEHV